MKELLNDRFYDMLEKKYNELLLDYVLLSFDEEYQGIQSHKTAVIETITVLNSRTRVGNSLKHPSFFIEEEKMNCVKCSTDDFFCEDNNKLRENSNRMNWAFSQPPYDVTYTKEDFCKINHVLFPIQFRNDLELYSWNDDFSNYFDDGKEWWGTALWSVYDKWMKRFIAIGASLTD